MITIADATTGGNQGSTHTLYGERLGRTVNYSLDLRNIDTTGLTATNNLYAQGISRLPRFDVPASTYFTSIDVEATTVQMTAFVDNGGYIRFQESRDNTGAATMNVEAVTSGTSDIVISGSYQI